MDYWVHVLLQVSCVICLIKYEIGIKKQKGRAGDNWKILTFSQFIFEKQTDKQKN